MNYFVTGIDTDSGKTLTSAILCEALAADYWKPIQCGLPRDTATVQSLVTNKKLKFHTERHLLKTPASPHAAAKVENVHIQLSDFSLPETKANLIIEGAGGCLVPLNENNFVIDLAVQFKAPIILVADLYLGSINHTLLTVALLKQKELSVKGIIFNGVPNVESESIILYHSGYTHLLSILPETVINQETVKKYAQQLSTHWHE
jgi:dethiobiotin synthetase